MSLVKKRPVKKFFKSLRRIFVNTRNRKSRRKRKKRSAARTFPPRHSLKSVRKNRPRRSSHPLKSKKPVKKIKRAVESRARVVGHPKINLELQSQKLVSKKADKGANPTPGALIGRITHFFPKISVVVVKTTHSPVSLGDRIIIVGPQTRFSQDVKSLQIESVDVPMASKGKLVGLKTDQPARLGDKVYRVVSM